MAPNGSALDPPGETGAFAPGYWLRHPEGFAVVTSSGRLGYVEEAIFGSRIDWPDFIVFRRSAGGERVLVPTSQIEDVRPELEEIRLRALDDLGAA